MQLASFSVTGFRSLASVQDIPLQRPTVLTGRNDSGKSSMLDALSYLLDPSQRIEAKDFPFREDESGDVDEEQVFVVTGVFELSDTDREATDLPEAVRIRRSARMESDVIIDGGYEVEQKVPKDPRLRNLHDSRLSDLRATAEEFGVRASGPANAKESFLQVLRPIAEAAPVCLDWVAAEGVVLERIPWFLYRTGVNASDVDGTLRDALKLLYREILDLKEIKEPAGKLQRDIESVLSGATQDLCDTIEKNCDGLTDVALVPHVSIRDAVLSGTQLFARRDGRQVSFEQAGTGRRQQVVQAIWEWENREIMRPGTTESVVIAYDEPDLSLDYARQRSFMDLVRKQCVARNVRAVVATHSVQMIDQVPLDNVVHLELSGGTTRLHRVPDGGTHDDFSTFIGQLTEELGLSTSSVLFERCFLLVEGASERKAFPRLFHLATGQRLQEAGIVLFDGEGNTAVLKLVKCLREMGKPVYVLVDADSKRDHPKLFSEERLREHGVPDGSIDYLGDANELEELFTDQQWSDVGNKFWPHQDGMIWESSHFSVLRSSGKFSAKVSNLLNEKSKPQLMARMAEIMNHRDDLPAQLAEAFDKLIATLRNEP